MKKLIALALLCATVALSFGWGAIYSGAQGRGPRAGAADAKFLKRDFSEGPADGHVGPIQSLHESRLLSDRLNGKWIRVVEKNQSGDPDASPTPNEIVHFSQPEGTEDVIEKAFHHWMPKFAEKSVKMSNWVMRAWQDISYVGQLTRDDWSRRHEQYVIVSTFNGWQTIFIFPANVESGFEMRRLALITGASDQDDRLFLARTDRGAGEWWEMRRMAESEEDDAGANPGEPKGEG